MKFALLGLAVGGVLSAQAQPAYTALNPAPNAQGVPRSSAVTATFSELLAGTSSSALRVFSSQRGGQRVGNSGTVLTNDRQLSFQPAYPWQPGETVRVSFTTGIQATNGQAALPRVLEFTAATGGTGQGSFQNGGTTTMGSYPNVLQLADLDGDGDLDMVSSNSTYYSPVPSPVSIRLNDGQGQFGGSTELPVALGPEGAGQLTLGDLDGDGDLDLLTSNLLNTVSIRFNNGQGSFTTGLDLAVGSTRITDAALADLDADGDLDLLVYGVATSYQGLLQVMFNTGSGLFSSGYTMSFTAYQGSGGGRLQLADLDRDGDLDLVRSGKNGSVLYAHFNNGATGFGAGIQLPGNAGVSFLLGDVDRDGAPDLLTLNAGASGSQAVVGIYRNNGGLTASSVAFTLSSTLAPATVAGGPVGFSLADLNADGLADLLLGTNYRLYAMPAASQGGFSPAYAVAATRLDAFTSGDVDGDGDLDVLATDWPSSPPGSACPVFCYLNQPAVIGLAATSPAAGQLLLYPNPATQYCTLVLPQAVQATSVTLFSTLGQPILVQPALPNASGSIVLPLAGLAPGLYLLQVNTTAGRLTRQLVKE